MHRCTHGFTTARARQDWLRGKGIAPTDANSSLVADPDTSVPLYFWQLHSLLGWRRIEAIVRSFYERVYADDEAPWFKEAFTRISGIDHHVDTQAAFWIDAMGGGRQYHGGDGRINFHHHHNAAQVMTAEGARRWMHHMTLTLNEDVDWSGTDPRVKPCLVDFLLVRMRKYAATHRWRMDESEFDALLHPPAHLEAELRAMPAARLRKIARDRGVDVSGVTDKAEIAGLLAVTREELLQLPTPRLRRLLKERGVRVAGLLEKSEFVDAFFRHGEGNATPTAPDVGASSGCNEVEAEGAQQPAAPVGDTATTAAATVAGSSGCGGAAATEAG